MHQIGMFDRESPLEVSGLDGSGADFMPEYKRYIVGAGWLVGGARPSMRAAMVFLAIALVVAGAAPESRVFALELSEMRIAGGVTTKPNGIAGAGVVVAFAPRSVPALLRLIGDDVRYELAASNWRNAAAGGGDVQMAHIGPVWRYRPWILPARSFVDVGTSIARVSRPRLFIGPGRTTEVGAMATIRNCGVC